MNNIPPNNYRIIGPHRFSEDFNYVQDFISIIQQSDNENWAYFAPEKEEEIIQDILDNGHLSRLIYKDNQPVGCIQCYLLKQNSPFLLKNDTYKKYGLSSNKLILNGSTINESTHIQRHHLYINVISIKKSERMNLNILHCIDYALLNIIEANFAENNSPEFVFATVISPSGAKMCRLNKMTKLSEATRTYQHDNETIINKRELYYTQLHKLVRNIKSRL